MLAKLLDDLLDVARIARGKISVTALPVDVVVLVEGAGRGNQPPAGRRTPPSPDRRSPARAAHRRGRSAALDPGAGEPDRQRGQVHRRGRRDPRRCPMRRPRSGHPGVGQRRRHRARHAALRLRPLRAGRQDTGSLQGRAGPGSDARAPAGETAWRQRPGAQRRPGQGRGAFVVRLPLLDDIPTPSPAPQEPLPATDPSAVKGRRVMVVDDNTDAAESLAVVLELHGHQVKVVHDAREVVAVADRFPAPMRRSWTSACPTSTDTSWPAT
ncbi:MAG: hypothetical protein MZW92_75275 [Comamonadaceae bacterium]|nr:hypothetical protein [Comamonadaceae bacterium]